MIIPQNATGRINVSADNTVVTAEAPLFNVCIRVTGKNCVVDGLIITGSDNANRPAMIEVSGSTNCIVKNVTLIGVRGKQEQGIYGSGFTNLQVLSTTIKNVGINPVDGDHAIYLGNGTFTIDQCDLSGSAGAGLQLYPSNITGTISNSKLYANNWGAVVWGPQCVLIVDKCQIYNNKGSRGFGVHAASGGLATVNNSYLWNNQNGDFEGNVDYLNRGNIFSAPVDPVPPPPDLFLTNDPINKDPNATVWVLGWIPVPDAYGYRFFADGKAVSWTADPSRSTVKIKRGAKTYSVQVLKPGPLYTLNI